jgi:hypothetical protein
VALLREDPGERPGVQQLHDDPRHVTVVDDVDDGDHRGRGDAGRRPGLAQGAPDEEATFVLAVRPGGVVTCLTATSRCRRSSVARQTVPIPPLPRCAPSR